MKRFTETQKWEDPWFRKLRPELKLLWQWLCDRCDNAGVIDPDIELASFQIGYQYPMDTLSEFGGRVVDLGCGKKFIPSFIEFQYGQLSTECKAHKPIFISLKKHGIKGYPKGIHTLQEKETDQEEEKEKEEEEPPTPFADASAEKPLCTIAQARDAAPSCRLSPDEAEFWWHTRNASGWTKSSASGGHPRRITSWQSDLATSAQWVREQFAASRLSTAGASAPVRNFTDAP